MGHSLRKLKKLFDFRPFAHSSRLDPLEYELAAADIGSVNWQERCLELQLELHRSRHQATRVRDMLRDKVRIMKFTYSILCIKTNYYYYIFKFLYLDKDNFGKIFEYIIH